MRPAKHYRTAESVSLAIQALKLARQHLKNADCPQALKKVRLALASAYGARRHAHHREAETFGYTATAARHATRERLFRLCGVQGDSHEAR